MGRAVILALPFLIGLAWSLVSPFFVRRLADRFEGEFKQELSDAGYQEASQSGPRQAAPNLNTRKPNGSPAAADAESQRAQELADTAENDHRPVIPLPARPANLRTYVDWLVDVPQLLPTILLGAAGVVVAVAEASDVVLTYIVCAAAAVVGAIATFCIMKMNPKDYSASGRFWIFTRSAFIAFAVNLAAAVIIIVGVAP